MEAVARGFSWDLPGVERWDDYHRFLFRNTLTVIYSTFSSKFNNFEMHTHYNGEFCEAYFYIGDEYIKVEWLTKDVLFRSADSYLNEIAKKFLEKKYK